MNANWDIIRQNLKKENQAIVILSHRSPDGDSIGSSLGLFHYLKEKHQVKVISPDPVPPFLHWLPSFDSAINFEKNEQEARLAISSASIIFCLDFNDPSRMGSMEDAYKQRKDDCYVVNIDHHQNPSNFADFQISNTKASSTCELIYEFLEQLDSNFNLSKEMAACLYTGILTDTGSFRFSSTSSKTHQIAAELISTGIEVNKIYQNIFDNYSQDRIKLLGFALKDKLKLYPDFHAAIIDLSERELQKFNFQKGDTEGIVNFPLSISWVKLAVLLTQKDGIVKISFRSKGNFKVNELANKHFNGGGHENAAGGMSTESMQETIERLELVMKEYQEKLLASAI